ncbi:MAG: NUDIX domain-containing protein [Candidatus Micrarchaeota archaeon]
MNLGRAIYFDRKGAPHALPAGVKPEKRRSVYGIALKRDRLLLLSSEVSPKKFLPGGAAEESESDEEALKREFLEETGYEIGLLSKPLFRFTDKFFADDLRIYYDSEVRYYLVRLRRKAAGPTDVCEIKSVEFVPLKEVSEKNCARGHWPAVKKFVAFYAKSSACVPAMRNKA